MSSRACKKKGRKPHEHVKRYPSGRVHDAQPLAHIVPVEALLRRAEAVGLPMPTTEGHRARLCVATEAATAAGALWANDHITARQYEAAKRFERLSATVRRLTGAQLGWAMPEPSAAPVPWEMMSPEQQASAREQWDRVRSTFKHIMDEISRLTRRSVLVRCALESVVIDNVVPPLDRPYALDALKVGLDAVAAVYKLPRGDMTTKPVVLAKRVDATA